MITVAIAGRDDLDQLLQLYKHLNTKDPTLPLELARSRFDEMLSHPGLEILCGFLDGGIVSSCTLIVIPNLTRGGAPYALIENVVTDGGFRRRGLGRTVLEHAIGRAFSKGCYKVMLMTGRTDDDIVKFYENCGFSQSKKGFQIRKP